MSRVAGLTGAIRGGALHWLVKMLISVYTCIVAFTRFFPGTSAHGVITGVVGSAPVPGAAAWMAWVEEDAVPTVAHLNWAGVYIFTAALVAILAVHAGSGWGNAFRTQSPRRPSSSRSLRCLIRCLIRSRLIRWSSSRWLIRKVASAGPSRLRLPRGLDWALPDAAVFMWGVIALNLDLAPRSMQHTLWATVGWMFFVMLCAGIATYRGYRALPLSRALPAKELAITVLGGTVVAALLSAMYSTFYPLWGFCSWASSGGAQDAPESASAE